MAFVNGYIGGFGMGAILCVAAVYGVIVYAQMLLMTTAASVAMTVTMTVYSVIENKEKKTLVYGTLAILSLISLYQAYGFYGAITIMGSKGSAKISVEDGTTSGNSNKDTLLNALKDAPVEYRKNPNTGIMEPYMKQAQITDDYKVILRRDVGDFGLQRKYDTQNNAKSCIICIQNVTPYPIYHREVTDGVFCFSKFQIFTKSVFLPT